MAKANAISGEIEAAYHHYIEVFNREDAAAFVGCYAHPHVMLSGEQGLSSVQTEADHHKVYQNIMAGLRASEWGRSDIDRLQVFPYAESLAQIVADVTRYKRDGSVLEKLRATYMYQRDEESWKIVSLALVEAPFSGPGQSR
jgi:ketosteroid isomerase-like protein